jgi:lactoylglutathione lyase
MLEGNLRGAQHLGIPVENMEAAKVWYTQTLGLRVIHEPVLPTPDGTIKAAFLQLDDLTLELYQLVGGALDEIRTRGHGHIDHFALDVLDLDQALLDARRAGAVLDDSTPDGPLSLETFWSRGARYVFLRGPNGEKVELNQRLDLSPTRRRHNLGGWSHLGVPVTGLQRSREFYSRFGFQEVMRAELPTDHGLVRMVMMEHVGLVLELFQLAGEDLAEIRSRKDGHIDHIALDVLDVDRAFADIRAAGMNTLEEAPLPLPFWDRGARYFNVRGPDGEKVEFNQIIR